MTVPEEKPRDHHQRPPGHPPGFRFSVRSLCDHQRFQLADQQSIDLPSFYFAADVTFNDHASPYRAGAWDGSPEPVAAKGFPFLYPPPSLLFFLPFSWFSYATVKAGVAGRQSSGPACFCCTCCFSGSCGCRCPGNARLIDETDFLPWLILAVVDPLHPAVSTPWPSPSVTARSICW